MAGLVRKLLHGIERIGQGSCLVAPSKNTANGVVADEMSLLSATTKRVPPHPWSIVEPIFLTVTDAFLKPLCPSLQIP